MVSSLRDRHMSVGSKVCAVVVTYYPDVGLWDRLARVLPQVDALIIVDNTPAGSLRWQVDAKQLEAEKVDWIRNQKNLGVAAALNQGLSKALELDCDWLLTLDQDSRCYPSMTASLLTVASSCTPEFVVIGGNYLDTRNGVLKVPIGKAGEYVEQKTVITSGCLVNSRFAKQIGGFRDDYFIDQVDHEFCLRVRVHGGRVVISKELIMEHSVGECGGVKVWGLGMLPKHPPLRKYYIARNSIATIVQYWRDEPAWCLRRGTRLLLGLFLVVVFEPSPLLRVRAFMVGVKDAVFRRMGPARHPWLSKQALVTSSSESP